MKAIIDKNGKLFGLINVIDLIVMMLLLLLLPTFYFAYKIFTKKPPIEIVNRVLPVLIEKVPNHQVNQIRIGDRQLNSNDSVIAEIVAIKGISHFIDSIVTGDNRSIVGIEDTNFKMIYVDLKIRAKKINNKFVFENQIFSDENYSFNKNKTISFKTIDYNYKCKVAKYVSPPPELVYQDSVFLNSWIRFSRLSSNEISARIKDLKMYENEKSFKFLKVLSIDPDSIMVNFNRAAFKTSSQYERLDIIARMKYSFTEDQMFWNDQNITSNSYINFVFPQSNLKAEIIEIEYKPKKKLTPKKVTLLTTIALPELLLSIKSISKNDLLPDVKAFQIDSILQNQGTRWYGGHQFENKTIYDLYLSIELKCSNNEDGFYYNNQKILIGNSLTVDFKNNTLRGTIIEIE